MDNDDITLRSYQDDLEDTDRPDPFMDEQAEDPAVNDFGVSDSVFASELDKVIDDEDEDYSADDVDIKDDERNFIEDVDDEHYR